MQEVRTIADEKEKHHEENRTKVWLDHLKFCVYCQSVQQQARDISGTSERHNRIMTHVQTTIGEALLSLRGEGGDETNMECRLREALCVCVCLLCVSD